MEIYLIVLCIVVVLVASGSIWLANKINQTKQAKIISDMQQMQEQKNRRKEAVINEANERKAQVNGVGTQSGFDASISILQDLSTRKR